MKYKTYKIKIQNILNKISKENIDFIVDFSKYYNDLIDSVTLLNENAFLYQLSKLEEYTTINEDSFINDLLLIDFSGINIENNKTKIEKLFDNHGFTFININNKTIKYVPYDKSKSMTKDCKIYFINEKLKKRLDERLLLGLKFDERCKIIPSKYFAYRGLYLTESIRINNIELNEKTVVVIEDERVASKKTHKVFTASKNNDGYVFKTINDYKFKNDDFTNYDGEGFISCEYGNLINEETNACATSFQIRMPFIKGMLHEVDFKDFIKSHNKDNIKDIKIKDAFGFERDLDDAKIILTKSMFKCYKWLVALLKNKEFISEYDECIGDKQYDVMKMFFRKIKDYEHSLYLVGTNESLDNKNATKKTTLNNQYLSTLMLDKDGFNRIIDSSIEQIKNVENTFILEDNDEEEELLSSDESIYKKVVTLNPNFLYEDRIKGIVNSTKRSYVKNIGLGKLLVDGQCCLLSSDLLALLLHLYNQTNLDRSFVDYIKYNCLIKENSFYMPNSYIELDNNKYYAILRSPHLSKNEGVLSKPYKLTKDSLMEKYFGHLIGILMFSKYSVFPLTLGGADFDGDLVKIFSNEDIVKAVKKGCYDDAYKRVAPIILIPSEDSNDFQDSLEYISYKTISNTFSNQIGKISMFATQYGELANITEVNEDYQSKCSIVAGIEIDASKTGNHPYKLIDSLQKEYDEKIEKIAKDKKISFSESIDSNYNARLALIKKTSSYYWLKRELFKDLKPSEYRIIEKENKRYISKENKQNEIKKPSISSTNLYELPYRFIDGLNEYKKNQYNKKQDGILFSFEEDENWKNSLDNGKLKQLADLMDAYKKIITKSQSSVLGNNDELSKHMSYILSNLQEMYGPVLENYKEFDIKYALDKTINYLENYKLLNDEEDLINIYESLRKEKLDNDMYLLLFNPDYNDNDNPIGLFKYIVKYVKEKKQIMSLETSSESEDVYFNEFNNIYTNACIKKQEKKVWSYMINLKASNYLDKIINKNDNRVMYVYALLNKDTPNKDFFWDVLDSNDILLNIFTND